MGDKDITSMARTLATISPLSVTVAQIGEVGDTKFSRYSDVGAMQQAWRDAGCDARAMPIDAIAAKLSQNNADTVIVTGSLYFLGHLLKELNISI
jgi:folylpolyglutamate synthase/dihydropteroate synthase